MIPLFVAALVLGGQDRSELPSAAPTTVTNEVRDWAGFKYLPAAGRTFPKAFRTAGDWSDVTTAAAPGATIWHTKVIVWDRVDTLHEKGPDFLWPGHRALGSIGIAAVRRALTQFRALVLQETKGQCDVVCDVTVESEPIQLDVTDLEAKIVRYLTPRMNGGRYDAEDGVFRGPYQSAFVIFPGGGDTTGAIEVGGAAVDPVTVPEIGIDADGWLGAALTGYWNRAVATRAWGMGIPRSKRFETAVAALTPSDWAAVAAGPDASAEDRLRLFASPPAAKGGLPSPHDRAAFGERGPETTLSLGQDPERGKVLVMSEGGPFRAGGFALPKPAEGPTIPNVAATPTLSFWVKSEALDPIVLQVKPNRTVRLGVDVPFAYDGAWHRVKIDLRPATAIDVVLVAPEESDRRRVRNTLGPIVAYFSDFEATDEAPDLKPTPEAPGATALSPEARAAWAATAEPGDARRLLMKDPIEAVRANAVAAAFARPDPADERSLIESALFTFEPTIFTPALRALGKLTTPAAGEALRRALRSAASDRARGLAAEILTEGGDPKFVPLLIGLNQARSRAARIAAVRSLGRIPGSESGLMRMAFLSQEDPEVKLETTLTADANDDYQGRKLLWSAVNEPSDAVRLESLRRLSYSKVNEFQAEGMKGVRDDSVGLRVGLLQAWTIAPRPEFVSAIRVALADRSPRVRAAALDALGAVGKVDAKDVPFDDADPWVQLAILRLAKAKGLIIPAPTLERYRKSPDPRVRAGVP